MKILKKYKNILIIGTVLSTLFYGFTNCSRTGLDGVNIASQNKSEANNIAAKLVQVNTMLVSSDNLAPDQGSSGLSRSVTEGNGTYFAVGLWPKGELYFSFDEGSVSAENKALFALACAKFVDSTTTSASCIESNDSNRSAHPIYVKVRSISAGNSYSQVGMPSSANFDVDEETGFYKNSIVVVVSDWASDADPLLPSHKLKKLIGHAFGLQSEYNRSDRDTYVKGPSGNLPNSGKYLKLAQSNQYLNNGSSTGAKYDYTSIMHDPFIETEIIPKLGGGGAFVFAELNTYPNATHTVNTSNTIVPAAPDMMAAVGRNIDLSANDKSIMSKLYPPNSASGGDIASADTCHSGSSDESQPEPYQFGWTATSNHCKLTLTPPPILNVGDVITIRSTTANMIDADLSTAEGIGQANFRCALVDGAPRYQLMSGSGSCSKTNPCRAPSYTAAGVLDTAAAKLCNFGLTPTATTTVNGNVQWMCGSDTHQCAAAATPPSKCKSDVLVHDLARLTEILTPLTAEQKNTKLCTDSTTVASTPAESDSNITWTCQRSAADGGTVDNCTVPTLVKVTVNNISYAGTYEPANSYKNDGTANPFNQNAINSTLNTIWRTTYTDICFGSCTYYFKRSATNIVISLKASFNLSGPPLTYEYTSVNWDNSEATSFTCSNIKSNNSTSSDTSDDRYSCTGGNLTTDQTLTMTGTHTP